MSAPSLLERDARVIANVGRLRFCPVALARGEGSYLFEENGRRLLDLSASCGPAVLGYGHPQIVEAVARATAEHGWRQPARLSERRSRRAGRRTVAHHARQRRAPRVVRSFRIGRQRLRGARARGGNGPPALHLFHRFLSRQPLGLDGHQRAHRDDAHVAARGSGAAALSGSVPRRVRGRGGAGACWITSSRPPARRTRSPRCSSSR